jgi:hypothetical protein
VTGDVHHQGSSPRDAAALASQFHVFGRVEAPELDSPMYAELSYGVAQDSELIELTRHTRPGQPVPNMLFAAVQFLLLSGSRHPLAAHYPAISGEPRPLTPAFPHFRDFCLTHRDSIVPILSTRLTQTNVIQRCACLLPMFAMVHRETASPLALIEVGPSAGLNMNWDRYRYTYLDPSDHVAAEWGDAQSCVNLRCGLWGPQRPVLSRDVPATWRIGVDISPVDLQDPDQVLWLRALIWPEHVERQEQLLAAIEVARTHETPMVRGDAVERLPELLAQAPDDSAVVVYATHVLYQLSREQRVRLLKSIEASAVDQGRRVDFVTMESSGAGHSQIFLHVYGPEGRISRESAHANPHGRWLRWLSR